MCFLVCVCVSETLLFISHFRVYVSVVVVAIRGAWTFYIKRNFPYDSCIYTSIRGYIFIKIQLHATTISINIFNGISTVLKWTMSIIHVEMIYMCECRCRANSTHSTMYNLHRCNNEISSLRLFHELIYKDLKYTYVWTVIRRKRHSSSTIKSSSRIHWKGYDEKRENLGNEKCMMGLAVMNRESY